MAKITKAVIKNIKSKDCALTEEEALDIKKRMDRRLRERERDKELKLTLKRKIARHISENYKNLIGVVEREAYHGFYGMEQVNVKYHKGLRSGNYMDYLCAAELYALNTLKEKLIVAMDSVHSIGSIDGLGQMFYRYGRAERSAFIEKYRTCPEDVPAEEVSCATLEKAVGPVDALLQLRREQSFTKAKITEEAKQAAKDYDRDLFTMVKEPYGRGKNRVCEGQLQFKFDKEDGREQ